jgi:hypothetical protein
LPALTDAFGRMSEGVANLGLAETGFSQGFVGGLAKQF